MKKYLAAFTVLFLVLGVSGVASAVVSNVLPEPTGELIGIFDRNDPSNPSADLSDFENVVADFLGIDTIDLDFYAKVNFGSTTVEGDGSLTLSYVYDGRESKTGSWTTGTAVNLYSVKAGNGYALYWLGDDGMTSGTWSTIDRSSKGISHLSTWVVTGGSDTPPGPAPTPEPGTIALLGFGLIGLAGVRRKFQNK